jgi:hypothetical protein
VTAAPNGTITNNGNGTIGNSNGSTNVSGGAVTNNGTLAGNSTNVTGTSLTNNGSITGGNVSVNVTGNVTNTGKITGKNVTVNASKVVNPAPGVIAGTDSTTGITGSGSGVGTSSGGDPLATALVSASGVAPTAVFVQQAVAASFAVTGSVGQQNTDKIDDMLKGSEGSTEKPDSDSSVNMPVARKGGIAEPIGTIVNNQFTPVTANNNIANGAVQCIATGMKLPTEIASKYNCQ